MRSEILVLTDREQCSLSHITFQSQSDQIKKNKYSLGHCKRLESMDSIRICPVTVCILTLLVV